MAVAIIGMYANATGGVQNALAAIDIPQDGVLIGIDWDMTAMLDATLESSEVELSFIATHQTTTNDVRGRISSISTGAIVLTAVGVNTVSVQKWLGGFDLFVSGGERIFLHVVASAGVVSLVRCNLFYDASGNMRRSSRRR